MSEGERELGLSTVGDKRNRANADLGLPSCGIQQGSAHEGGEAPDLGGQIVCLWGFVLLAGYLLICHFCPAIPTTLLALATAASVLSEWENSPRVTVSSQTSSTTTLAQNHRKTNSEDGQTYGNRAQTGCQMTQNVRRRLGCPNEVNITHQSAQTEKEFVASNGASNWSYQHGHVSESSAFPTGAGEFTLQSGAKRDNSTRESETETLNPYVPEGVSTVANSQTRSSDGLHTGVSAANGCCLAAKSKRSQKVTTSKLRVSASEPVAGRRGVPAFGKVWREPDFLVTSPIEISNGGDFSQLLSDDTSADDTTTDNDSDVIPEMTHLGRPPRCYMASQESRPIHPSNPANHNLNCHDCSATAVYVPPNYLSDPISTWHDGAYSQKIQRTPPCMPDACSALPLRIDQSRTPVGHVAPPSPQTVEVQTQTTLFADILRINVRSVLQSETRRFQTRRSRLRFKVSREIEKLKRELTGKNRILSSLQWKIPELEGENRKLRGDMAEVEGALLEERQRSATLMGRLKDVYDKLMVINSAQVLQQQQQQILQFDQPM